MDNYIVSARKYRPSTFRSVVGQQSLTTTLKNAIHSNKLAHAYLFCGPRGVGKTSCARIFAKTINCMNLTSEGEACNECESCKAFNEQRSYNIHELDAASNNSVDDIRSLIEQVRIPPQIGKYKVYIIDEVHMLSPAAFNAFLKTLEEPPHHALFILATTEKHKILPTILSRCQIYDFSRISVSDTVAHLQYVAASEGVTADADALNVIAQKSDGGMRDALSIFDQVVSYTGGNITYQTVIDNLNVLDYEYYFKLTEAILGTNVFNALLILNDILNKGFDGQHVITGLSSHFRDLLVCRDKEALVLFEVGATIRERYLSMAMRCPDTFLFKAIELANTCDLNYRASNNKRLLLELTLIQLCQLQAQSEGSDSKKKGIIESIPQQAPVHSNSSVQQVAQRTSTVTTQTVPGNNISQPIQQNQTNIPVQTPVAAANSGKKPMGMPRAISIKNIGEEKPADEVKREVVQQEMVTSFREEELIRFWNLFADTAGEKVYLKNTMINCKPTLKENYVFEVAVHNPGQQQELENSAVDLLPYLRSNLRNTRIQMSIRIIESNEKHLAYTSTEKYDLLLRTNPVLTKLKEEFNLILD
ncbi:DNA polymerase III, subunit gamma and tau [Macellibacteroides sp. HH-ZS]|nr:DNA polymerase III, subunit gamma and tau [Macellibacteroides sp. HH-ZS]